MSIVKLDFMKIRPKVVISNINIKFMGNMHSIAGMKVSSRLFDLKIPFQNKTHSDMLTEAASFKVQKARPIVVKKIEVMQPFKLNLVAPDVPLEVKPDQKIEFKMKIEAPNYNYEGPLMLNFVSDEIEMVHIEISKTVLSTNGKQTEIETSSRILSLPKGQIFSEKVQLLKALSYGDEIHKIEIEKPFSFVSSDPVLPIKIDKTNSYILNLYIQAPNNPYAGTLEIKLS